MSDDRQLGRIEFDRDRGFTLSDARALRDGMDYRQKSVLALHRMMEDNDELTKHTRLEYRCLQRGCLLLRVFDTPAGPGVFRPAFRYSPERNVRSAPRARRERTSDGDRRWIAVGELHDADAPAGLGVEWWLRCDHVLDLPVPSARIDLDLQTRHAGPILLPDNSSDVR